MLRLRDARLARGFSQRRLAALTEMAQSDLSAIEHGRRRAGALRRRRLALVLGLSEAYLFAQADTAQADARNPAR
jgi:transcriptional regulator with XRE-family HTH domain